MNCKNYRDLEVWQKAMDLVVECYQITKTFPKHEIYGLVSQMQRAVISVPVNIAEGRGRQHSKEFINYLFIANGSLAEVETYAEIAARLHYITKGQSEKILDKASEIGRMLNGLIRSIQKRIKQ
jgi:four helix bundle protein